MQDLNGDQSLASFSDKDKISLLLKRESRFFVGIERSEFQRLTDALEQLDNFLEDANEDSTEQVMRESVDSWLEETVLEPDVKGYVEENCVLKLSRLLQERRVVEFLSQAGQRFGRLKSIRINGLSETPSEKKNMFSYSESENSKPYLSVGSESEKIETLSVDDEETGRILEEESTRSVGVVEGHNQKPFYSFLEEYVESTTRDFMDLLMYGPPKLSVISLVGPSGIGKTLLARKVYNNEIVGNRFNCCGWIKISSSYNIKEILKAIIKQINRAEQVVDVERINRMRTIQLLGVLRQYLQQKRYLFVFDNVCDEYFWHFIKNGFPNNEKGSRIIVTTHTDKLFADSCQSCSIDHVYCLGPLSDSISRDLFIRTTFQDEPKQLCPLELEQFTFEILRMCKGFPFPIVAIAGLLSTKDKTMSEWEKIDRNFRLEFKSNHNPPSALDVLTLSFLDLPNHLRPCFLYFSIFPEHSLISTDKLFKLWIAEGFVEEKEGRTLEEVAEEYLNELAKRNMVQACQDFQGLEKFCQVHLLMHNMARVKANQLEFFNVYDKKTSSFRKNSLRLSICNVSNASDLIPNSLIRAIFFYNIGALHSSFLVTLMNNCDLLTLLDLENVPVENLPEELGNLVHLKYLSLRNTKVKKLPKSVAKLQNLQTFDLRNTLLIELPLEVNKLRSLQHLLASVCDKLSVGDSTRGVRMREGIRWLDKLHTLTTLDVRLGGVNLIKEIAKLQRLRRLSISGLTAKDGIALCTALDALIYLETLILQAKRNEFLKLQTISLMLRTHLKCVVLKGQLSKFPSLILRLPNLTTLCLSLSKLTNDLLKDLIEFPNLVSLWLYQAYEGEKLYFKNLGFKKLERLVLIHLHGLNEVEIEEGALPRLEELRIGSSPRLNKVPFGIERLRNLKFFTIYDMPSKFVLSIQPYCLDYWKVEHISYVTFWYWVEGRSYKMFQLGDSELLDHILGEATSIDLFVLHPYELELSFCGSDDEEAEDDDANLLSNLSSS